MIIKTSNLLVCLFLCVFVAQARYIQVPADYKKIGDALANADAGDTIKVSKGVYDENITLIMGVVLLGDNPQTTIIDGGRRGPTVMGTPGAEIGYFTIRNGIEGVLCENATPYIHHNWIIDNHASGIAAFISLPSIKNNVIYGNRWSGILAWGTKSLSSKIEHNVVIKNGYSGITLKGPADVRIENNILIDNHYYGIYADPAAGQSKVQFNDIVDNYYSYNKFIKIDRTNIQTDPKFINPSLSSPNLFISTRSPLVRRGKGKTNIGLVERDVVVQENGDTDGDGLLDSDDTCPDLAEDMDDFEDEDGCPDTDNDKDGVLDVNDQCLNEQEDKDGYEDEDGCPETDNDGDGIADANDRCPNMAEIVNEFKDTDGCPDKIPSEPAQTFILDGINFKTGSAEITDDSEAGLMGVFDQLEEFPKTRFKIIGHTDNRGSKKKNKRLSKDRANSVKKWLVKMGISRRRIKSYGAGESKPIASNKTAAGREKNRRIEFVRTR